MPMPPQRSGQGIEDQKERMKTLHSLDIDAITTPHRIPANHRMLKQLRSFPQTDNRVKLRQ